MPTTTQLVISGKSKPGVLAQVAQVLGEAKRSEERRVGKECA